MTAPHVEIGHKVIVSGDPMTHVVSWTNHLAWDAACGLIVEDFQPDYYEGLCRAGPIYIPARPDYPDYRNPEDVDYSVQHPALQLQVAPDDAPVTCLLCLRALWRLGEGDTVDEEAEEDNHGPPWGP